MGTYRDVANTTAEYQSELRDNYIENSGISIQLQVPITENVLDSFGDLKTDDDTRIVSIIQAIPRFTEYYQIVDIIGQNLEEAIPLEVQIKSTQHVPNDTLLTIPTPSDDGGTQEMVWRVLSTEKKHLEVGYSKLIRCVPARNEGWEAEDV